MQIISMIIAVINAILSIKELTQQIIWWFPIHRNIEKTGHFIGTMKTFARNHWIYISGYLH